MKCESRKRSELVFLTSIGKFSQWTTLLIKVFSHSHPLILRTKTEWKVVDAMQCSYVHMLCEQLKTFFVSSAHSPIHCQEMTWWTQVRTHKYLWPLKHINLSSSHDAQNDKFTSEQEWNEKWRINFILTQLSSNLINAKSYYTTILSYITLPLSVAFMLVISYTDFVLFFQQRHQQLQCVYVVLSRVLVAMLFTFIIHFSMKN